MSEQLKRYATVKNLRFVLSLVMFAWLCWYFYTGFGGPSELVAALVPIALMLQILCMHENGHIYKRLPPIANHILVVIYLGICVYAFYHFCYGVRRDRDLAAGLLYPGGLHHGAAGLPAGDGALPHRSSVNCSG